VRNPSPCRRGNGLLVPRDPLLHLRGGFRVHFRLLAVRGYTDEVEQAYRRARPLLEEGGTVAQRFPVQRSLATFYLYRAEFDKAKAIGRELLLSPSSRTISIFQTPTLRSRGISSSARTWRRRRR
jgi:hypothetical protein